MKKIFLVALVLALIASMASCTSPSTSEDDTTNQTPGFGFEELYWDSNTRNGIYRETSTDLLYVRYSSLNGGGITLMVDPEDGMPLTYNEWQEKYAPSKNEANSG